MQGGGFGLGLSDSVCFHKKLDCENFMSGSTNLARNSRLDGL